jgi:hypothetical protein
MEEKASAEVVYHGALLVTIKKIWKSARNKTLTDHISSFSFRYCIKSYQGK